MRVLPRYECNRVGCTNEAAQLVGDTMLCQQHINRAVEALQDGECPCCHGNWPSPDATSCNGCGYELDGE